MSTTLLIILLVFFLFSYFGGFLSIYLVGLKKWWVWLFILVGFISAFLFGLISADMGLFGGLELGAIFVIITILGGAVTRWQRQYYSNKAESWLSLYEHDSRFSLLMRFIKRFTNKQNEK